MISEDTKAVLKTLNDIRKECKRIADALEKANRKEMNIRGGERGEDGGEISEQLVLED